MEKEDLIIELINKQGESIFLQLQQMQAEAITFKQEVIARFDKVELEAKEFRKEVYARFEAAQTEAREFRKEIREDLRDFKNAVRDEIKDTKDLIKAETVRIDEVYGERKKVEVSWTKIFLFQNVTLSSLTAFIVAWFTKS